MTDFTPTLTAATPKHQQIADRFIARLIESETRHTPAGRTVEIKEMEISHFDGHSTTYLLVVLGMVGDEGTMASVFCRNRRHIAIGPRGGLTLFNAKNKSEAKGWTSAIYSLTE